MYDPMIEIAEYLRSAFPFPDYAVGGNSDGLWVTDVDGKIARISQERLEFPYTIVEIVEQVRRDLEEPEI